MELITDRTYEDVLLQNEKGCYGIGDMNRVEQAVLQLCSLAEQLDMHPALVTKTDWNSPGAFSAQSWPVQSQMARYVQNVHSLCGLLGVDHGQVPESMEKLNYQQANAIEQALLNAYRHIEKIINTYRYSGECFAGEENCL